MDWLQIVNTMGLPVSLIVAIAYAVWQAIRFTGHWLDQIAPDVKTFFQSQTRLVDSLQETTQKQTGILETHTALLNEHGQKIGEIHRKVVRGE